MTEKIISKIVKALLEVKGIDVNRKNYFGYTALSLAHKPEIIDLLRQHGAK